MNAVDGAATWDAVLTSIENDLDAHEEAVRLGSIGAIPRWDPPEGLGPMPVDQVERAHALVQRIDLLSTFVQYQMTALDNDRKHVAMQVQRHSQGLDQAVSLYLNASV